MLRMTTILTVVSALLLAEAGAAQGQLPATRVDFDLKRGRARRHRSSERLPEPPGRHVGCGGQEC